MTDLKNLQEDNLIMRNEKVYKLTLTALMAAILLKHELWSELTDIKRNEEAV